MYRHPKSSFLEIRGADKNPRHSQSSFLFNSLCKDTFKVRGKVFEANVKKKDLVLKIIACSISIIAFDLPGKMLIVMKTVT